MLCCCCSDAFAGVVVVVSSHRVVSSAFLRLRCRSLQCARPQDERCAPSRWIHQSCEPACCCAATRNSILCCLCGSSCLCQGRAGYDKRVSTVDLFHANTSDTACIGPVHRTQHKTQIYYCGARVRQNHDHPAAKTVQGFYTDSGQRR